MKKILDLQYIGYQTYCMTNIKLEKFISLKVLGNGKMKLPNYIDLKGFLSFQIMYHINKRGLCGDDLALIIGGKKGKKLTPGTIYPALKFLREKRLVTYRRYGRKKIYKLTKKGLRELRTTKKLFKRIIKDIK